MKVNYDGNTKKFTVDVSVFDKIVNILIVIVICVCALYAIFRQDIKCFFASREQQKPAEQEVTLTSGNQLQWEEYRSIIGDTKLMHQYAKKKKTVTGFLKSPPSYIERRYVASIVESADATDSTVFIVYFTLDDYAKNINVGVVTITDENFYCGSGHSYLYCEDPLVVNETTE